jgi:DNA-binding transcriptional regulator YiaG
MPNIANALKAEIARIARKEIRAEADALKRSSAQHRRSIAALRKQVESLEKALRRASKTKTARSENDTQTDSTPARRFSPARLAAHRAKLRLSAAEYGRLVGVSGQTIYKWEQGNARPRRSQLESIATVRGFGLRQAAAHLREQQ